MESPPQTRTAPPPPAEAEVDTSLLVSPFVKRLRWALPLAVVLWAAYEAIGSLDPSADEEFRGWMNSVVLFSGALLCLLGAESQHRGKLAWRLIALAIASWAVGDTIWSLQFETEPSVPVASVADIFGLAWYPIVIAALTLLVRDRVPRFELHRWIDGIVVMLIVATPWVALFLQPSFDSAGVDTLDEILQVAYVIADAVLVGAVVGVCALLNWHPGRMWLLLGAGLAVIAVSDAVYSTQVLTGNFEDGAVFDIAWGAGMVFIAFAAWQPHLGQSAPVTAVGWRAIVLPVAAQMLAIGIQIYGFIDEIPNSERVLTIAVLLIVTVQIIVARPQGPD